MASEPDCGGTGCMLSGEQLNPEVSPKDDCVGDSNVQGAQGPGHRSPTPPTIIDAQPYGNKSRGERAGNVDDGNSPNAPSKPKWLSKGQKKRRAKQRKLRNQNIGVNFDSFDPTLDPPYTEYNPTAPTFVPATSALPGHGFSQFEEIYQARQQSAWHYPVTQYNLVPQLTYAVPQHHLAPQYHSASQHYPVSQHHSAPQHYPVPQQHPTPQHYPTPLFTIPQYLTVPSIYRQYLMPRFAIPVAVVEQYMAPYHPAGLHYQVCLHRFSSRT